MTVHYEDQAVAHLFTVAAGLDSMVVGETQVLGQLRAAYALAQEEGTVGRALHPIAQRALRVGKRVHTETGIDRAGASLVSVALDRAERASATSPAGPVLVVGAGSMGALAATTLARRGADVTVSSRTPATPRGWRHRRRPRRRTWTQLAEELAAADVLVTCTGASGTVVGTDAVAAALGRPRRPPAGRRRPRPAARRRPGGRRRCPACTWSTWRCCRASGATGQPVAGSVAAGDVAAARAMVEAEIGLLRAERRAAEVAPTVSALRSQAAEVVDAELLRLSTRLPDLDARAREEIARTVHRVVDKLLHEPTVRVKELASAPGGTDYASALRALFGLAIDADVEATARWPAP